PRIVRVAEHKNFTRSGQPGNPMEWTVWVKPTFQGIIRSAMDHSQGDVFKGKANLARKRAQPVPCQRRKSLAIVLDGGPVKRSLGRALSTQHHTIVITQNGVDRQALQHLVDFLRPGVITESVSGVQNQLNPRTLDAG